MEKDNIIFIVVGLLLTVGIAVGIYFLCVKVIFKPVTGSPSVGPSVNIQTEDGAYTLKRIVTELDSSNTDKTSPLDTDEITINGKPLLLLPNIDANVSNIQIQSMYSNGKFSWNGNKKMYENVPTSPKKGKTPTLQHIVDILNYQITFELPVFNQIVIKGLVLKDLDANIIPNISNKDIQLAFDQGKIKYNNAKNEFSI